MNDIIIQSIHIQYIYDYWMTLLYSLFIINLCFTILSFVKPFTIFLKWRVEKCITSPQKKNMKNKSRLRILSFIFPKQIQSINKYINGVKELPWPFVHWWWSGLDSQCNLPALFRTLTTEIYFLCSAIITEKKFVYTL